VISSDPFDVIHFTPFHPFTPFWRISMKISAIGASLAVVVASVASADVTYTFTNQTWEGFDFSTAFGAGTLTGSITAVKANATLNDSVGYTYADDLCIYVAYNPIALGGLLQAGGFSNLQATQKYSWANGGSSAPGTVVSSTRFLTTAISMAANPNAIVYVGNGYGAAGVSGTWTGTITLVGVELAPVPAPGAVALLGLAGAIGGRRRRA
jgi:MYXO-CTERM domain-containing protein